MLLLRNHRAYFAFFSQSVVFFKFFEINHLKKLNILIKVIDKINCIKYYLLHLELN